MIKKNLTVTIVHLENNLEEAQIDLKTCDDRSKVVLEPKAGKLTISATEILAAMAILEDFCGKNPVGEEKKAESEDMQVVYLDSEEDK